MNKDTTINLKIFLLTLFLVPFFVIAFFNQPCMDDYWSADIINHYGRLGHVKYFAENVNGRFFTNFLMGQLNTLPQGKMWLFHINAIVIILLFIASFYFFYKSIFPKEENKTILFLSLLFTVLHVLNMRTLFEGLYWTFATLSYQLAIIIFVIAAGSLLRNTRNASVYYSAIAIVCSFILPGCTESIASLYFIFLLVYCWFCFKQKKSVTVIISCIVINLAGIAIVLASKGNYLRTFYSSIHYKANIFLASYYVVRSLGYYSLLWLINPANIAALLLLTPFLINTINKVDFNVITHQNKKTFIVFSLVVFIMCFSIYFPEHYFESQFPYPRITTIFFFAAFHIFFLGCFLFFTGENKNKFINKLFAVTTKYQSYITAIFFIAIFCSRNFTGVTSDLVTGTAYNYALESKQRYETLKNCTTDTCYVNRHKYWASSIENFKKEELNTNPFVHIDKFFGKKILYKDSVNTIK